MFWNPSGPSRSDSSNGARRRFPDSRRDYSIIPPPDSSIASASGSFFQVNRFLIDDLVRAAIGDATGDRALDLYAGVGLFSLPLARSFSHVTSVESGASAVRDLRLNAERAGAASRDRAELDRRFSEKLQTDAGLCAGRSAAHRLGKARRGAFGGIEAAPHHDCRLRPGHLARDLPGLLAAGITLRG